MLMKISTRAMLGIALVVGGLSEIQAGPMAKIVGARVSGGKLYATVQTGAKVTRVEALNAVKNPRHFVIAEGGNALVYESPGTAQGGYEAEKAAVGRYLSGGEYSVLLDEPLNLERIRAGKTRSGRTAYIVSMADGGAGISTVYVCSTLGKVWQKRSVRVAGIRNGKVILNRYPDGEAGVGAKPVGTLFLDLDTLIDASQ